MTAIVYSSKIYRVSFFEVFAKLLTFFFVGRGRRLRAAPREAGVFHLSPDVTKRVLGIEFID